MSILLKQKYRAETRLLAEHIVSNVAFYHKQQLKQMPFIGFIHRDKVHYFDQHFKVRLPILQYSLDGKIFHNIHSQLLQGIATPAGIFCVIDDEKPVILDISQRHPADEKL